MTKWWPCRTAPWHGRQAGDQHPDGKRDHMAGLTVIPSNVVKWLFLARNALSALKISTSRTCTQMQSQGFAFYCFR